MPESTDRELLQIAFGADGLDVALVADGIAAIAALRTSSPRVVVLDLMLPIVSALEIVAEAAERRIPVLVFTGLDSAEHRQGALDAGAAAVFRKGEGLRGLREAVRTMSQHRTPGRRPGVATARQPAVLRADLRDRG